MSGQKEITAEAGHLNKYTLKYCTGSSRDGGKMNQFYLPIDVSRI